MQHTQRCISLHCRLDEFYKKIIGLWHSIANAEAIHVSVMFGLPVASAQH
jgi:hypothetical protein